MGALGLGDGQFCMDDIQEFSYELTLNQMTLRFYFWQQKRFLCPDGGLGLCTLEWLCNGFAFPLSKVEITVICQY